jgi:hypothetical protein
MQGIVWSFVSILPFMWLCVVAAASLGNVKITRKSKIDEQGQTDFSENTTEGVFLAALVRRWISGGGKGKKASGVVKEREKEVPEASVAQV